MIITTGLFSLFIYYGALFKMYTFKTFKMYTWDEYEHEYQNSTTSLYELKQLKRLKAK